MSDIADTDSWLWRTGRPLARLAAIGAGIACGVALLGAAMIAVLGAPADRPLPAAAPGGEPSNAGEPLKTFAGIPPVACLVERIGGPYVRVGVLVEAGKDPHIFEPSPRQVIELSRARLFFRVGMPFEDRLIRHIAGGPAQFTIVDTAAGIALRASSCACEAGHADHGHGDAEQGEATPADEDEGQSDPHIWLSPPLLKTMAGHVAAALCRADPRHEQVYQANLKSLDAELDALDRRIAGRLSPYRGQAFYVFHPAFGYFADRYGLRQESVEVEGKPPTPRQIFGLITRARKDRVKIIFLQPQFNQQIAASIAQAIGGAVVPMDSLAFDVAANLDDVAEKIAASNRGKTE